MITLKDIARECGVSFSTVSKALKGSPEISAEKIHLIQDMARQLGYHPNIAARTLRTNRTFDLGVIFEDKTGSGFQHQYFAKIISGFQDVAQSRGYDITFIGSNMDRSFDYYRHAKGKNLDGVAVLAADFAKDTIRALVQSELPTVTLDFTFDDGHSSVTSDNRDGMTKLTEYALSRGHKKIALLYGEDTLVTRERTDIFRTVTAAHGITIPDEYLIQTMYHEPVTSAEATSVLLSLPEPPTCIFYPDDYSALGGIRELNARGLVPGKDISIAGYDGIMLTSMLIPPLTTYEQDGEKMGEILAEKLIEKIESETSRSEHVMVTGRLLKGGTISRL